MSATPSSRSLLRLVLGAAFVLLGWVLASSTSAQADDRGVLGSTVRELGATLDSTLGSTLAPEKTTAPVRTAVEKVTRTVETAVDDATTTVDHTVEAVPVPATVTAPVKAVTAKVRATTRATTSRVLAPAVDVVTDTVDAVTGSTGSAGSLPGPVVLPGAGGRVVPGLDPGTGGPDPLASADRVRLERPLVSGADATLRTPAVATGPWVAPLSGRSTASGSPATLPELPSDHGPAVPGLDLSGLAPSAGSASSTALLLLALGMAFVLLRPEIFLLAPRFAVVRPVPGPVADPGSRPD